MLCTMPTHAMKLHEWGTRHSALAEESGVAVSWEVWVVREECGRALHDAHLSAMRLREDGAPG